MARRRLLSDEQLAPFWAWASDERAIVRQQYTLSRADLDLIAKKRTASKVFDMTADASPDAAHSAKRSTPSVLAGSAPHIASRAP
jgi:hypothetical protein